MSPPPAGREEPVYSPAERERVHGLTGEFRFNQQQLAEIRREAIGIGLMKRQRMRLAKQKERQV